MAFLQMRDVVKHYGGVKALDGATLSAQRGEVHGLLGPNGSGKSTLNKVLTGVVSADSATIAIDGTTVEISSPQDAAQLGIAAVYQQLTLSPELTVEQNIVLGIEPSIGGLLRPRQARKIARDAVSRLPKSLDGISLSTRVGQLGPGHQQLVELAKALARQPRILVLDEATASLHRDQVTEVFSVVRELCADGVCVLFVSHRLDEVYELCETATVVRSGVTVATATTAKMPEAELVRLMVGDAPQADDGQQPAEGTIEQADSRPSTPVAANASVVLRATGLTGPGIRGIDLSVRAGEIVGLGGLQGQGQSDLLLALFGAAGSVRGEVQIDGTRVRLRTPRQGDAAGIALVPGDRGTQGLLGGRPIQENLSVVSLARRAWGRVLVRPARERAAAQSMVEALNIKIGALSDPVSSLSGGNQQKVIVGKWLLAEPRLVLLDDPTKGVDVGAKAEIYALVRELAARGVGVIFNSSEDRELAELADRVVVLYEGRIVTEIPAEELTMNALVSAALRVDGAADDDGPPNAPEDGGASARKEQ